MKEIRIGELELLAYPRFEPYRKVTNVVTTRLGGRSAGAYGSLNLGLHVGDDSDAVLENRALVAQAVGTDPEALTIPQQVHGNTVAVVGKQERGRGAVTDDDALAKVDALVTNTPDVPLMVLVADCVTVSLYDPARHAIGLAHAGWKGTLGRIAERTVEEMTGAFGSKPADIIAGIGPSIGRGHYDVGEEVFEAFRREFGVKESGDFCVEDMDGTCYLDLWVANETQLLAGGLRQENIAISEMCTACYPARFYSHRRENGDTGRFAAITMLHSSSSRSY